MTINFFLGDKLPAHTSLLKMLIDVVFVIFHNKAIKVTDDDADDLLMISCLPQNFCRVHHVQLTESH